MSKQTLSALIKKRERLEVEIAAAQAAEKRKSEVLAIPEFSRILYLSDTILRDAFARIAAENQRQN